MSAACGGCGRPSRPLMLMLLLAPVGLGAVAVVTLLAARGSEKEGLVLGLVTLAFVAFTAALVRFGLSVLAGRACPQCGRRLTGSAGRR